MSTMTVEVHGHVLHIGLNRANKRNAFNLEMLQALAAAYTQLEDDDNLRCAVVFAHGDHFTAGLDLAEVGPAVMAGKALFPAEHVDPLGLSGRLRTKPVVIAVCGYCFTIGIELALACDVRVAAEGTRFKQMEVQRGIMPFGGATLRFQQVAGWGNAMRWLLTGDEFGPDEALRMGLVQEVAPFDEHIQRAVAIAERIAAQAPLAVQATRRNAQVAARSGEEAALEAMMGEARGLMSTEDAHEGMMSFVERRAAVFTGK